VEGCRAGLGACNNVGPVVHFVNILFILFLVLWMTEIRLEIPLSSRKKSRLTKGHFCAAHVEEARD
jgi:preprotein translocase subunit SecY